MTDTVTALRAFNRFHTRFVGALDAQYMGSAMSLPEARLLYEILHHQVPCAKVLQAALGIDAGYMSRLLKGLETRGWIVRARGADARLRPIALTPEGQAVFDALNVSTRSHVEASISHLGATDRAALVDALQTVETLLGGEASAPWSIRTFRPGDMGMIAGRQSLIYAEGWGWGVGLEILEGEVTTSFLRDFKPGRDQCWVAERGGRMIGAIFCIDSGDNAAQLRLLHVEPWARGLGVGQALVETCVAFARAAGYDKIWLWTHAVLGSARKLYDAAGFEIIATDYHDGFGKREKGETWALVFDR